jgi:hypothetical protein
MELALKAPRSPQRYTCILEVAVATEGEYRDIGENVIRVATEAGQNLLSLSLSSEIVQHLAAGRAQAMPSINIDGRIGVIFDDEFQQPNNTGTVALDQLVAEAVSPAMLEDEPDAKQMLSEFRTRLLKSLEHVEQAIASLPKP